MNIVMLGPFGLQPKGTMRARALPAARALAARGDRVTVIMPPWHTPEEAGRAWDDPTSGVRLEYVSLAGLTVPAAGHAVVAARMARRAVDLRPDVVHAFKPKAYSGLAAALLRIRQRLGAAFALVMDSDDWEGRGGWNDLEPYSRLQRSLFARQERWGLRHADAVTLASRALETLVWALGVAPGRAIYLPNAVESIPPVRPAGRNPARPPTLLLFTRFFEFDPARPLEVLARLRLDWPEARLVVAGRGLFGEERAFLALAAVRGLAEAVDYRGWVAPGDLAELFAGADVALYPFDDTLVNRTKSAVKLLDQMAAGLPVVAEAVGENREVIQDGRSGLLVNPGDIASFADAVSALIADPARRAAMGAAARARVATAFTWGRRVSDLDSAYRLARAHRQAGRPHAQTP